MKRYLCLLVWGCLLLTGPFIYAQQSANVVDFQVTYDLAANRYTAWVVPRYNLPNSNNTGTVERGGTAQFTIKVPSSFSVTDIQSIRGQWETAPVRLGPGNPGQNWTGSGLDPAINYYVIGKAPAESDYGTFVSGTPVALFTFRGNGCFGPVSPLEAGNPFIAEADQRFSLNVANSFYSRSAQPAGGNQNPLEQFRTVTGGPAQCAVLLANPDAQTLTAGTTVPIPVLTNDTDNGQPVSSSAVTVTISTPPATGTATVNANGTISYTPAPGFSGPVSFTYTLCSPTRTDVCSSAAVNLTVNPAATVLVANPDTQVLTTGTTATIPVLNNDTRNGQPVSSSAVTVTISTPPSTGTATVNANGSIGYTPAPGFTGPVAFTYTICDKAQPTVCASAPVALTVLAGALPRADLLVTKQVSQPVSVTGSVVSFTVTVQNLGPGGAVGVLVTDTLARNGLIQLQGSTTPSKGSFDPTTGIWNVGDLAANEKATLVLTAIIRAEGVIVNLATATATGSQDPNPNNNEASACTSVPFTLCPGESLAVSVPNTFQNIQWFRNGSATPIATGNSTVITLAGTYTVSAQNGACPITGCCPIIVQDGACCPVDKCIPFTIKKTKTRV